ncbi:MAG: hypothetical protein WKF65_02195 [Gaiellaceae bacterium]
MNGRTPAQKAAALLVLVFLVVDAAGFIPGTTDEYCRAAGRAA